MRRLLWIILCLGPFALLAQENRYDVSLNYGFYNAPNYFRAESKQFFAADFEYHLSKRWTISSGFIGGKFIYFDDIRSNVFPGFEYEPSPTNAKGYDSHAYLTLSYSFINKRKFLLQAGSGIGLFTRRLKYPYDPPSSGGGRGPQSRFTAEESFSHLEVPIKVDAYYMLGRQVGVGVKLGAFFVTDRSVEGVHIGPQLRLRL